MPIELKWAKRATNLASHRRIANDSRLFDFRPILPRRMHVRHFIRGRMHQNFYLKSHLALKLIHLNYFATIYRTHQIRCYGFCQLLVLMICVTNKKKYRNLQFR